MNVASETSTDDNTVSESGSTMKGSAYSQTYADCVFVTLTDMGRPISKDGAEFTTEKIETLRILNVV